MRTVVLLVCLAVGCLTQVPKPCKSPPLLNGTLSVSNPNFQAFAKYTYDALGERIHFKEMDSYEKKSFASDVLLLFRENIVYTIHHGNKTCRKERMEKANFHPMEIPKNAILVGQVTVGSPSVPGQGLLVNTWYGEHVTPTGGKDKWMTTFTNFGCIPVSTKYYTEKTEWVFTTFFNIAVAVDDPQEFIPPTFCQNAQLEETAVAADIYSLLKNSVN